MAFEVNNGSGARIRSFSKADALKRFGVDLLPGAGCWTDTLSSQQPRRRLPKQRLRRRYGIIEIVGGNFYRLLGRTARDFTRDYNA
jgi:hypothetical protein